MFCKGCIESRNDEKKDRCAQCDGKAMGLVQIGAIDTMLTTFREKKGLVNEILKNDVFKNR